MMNDKQSERRLELRVRFEHPVKCMMPEVIFEGRAVNLSGDGLYLQSPVPLEVGTEMAIMFSYSTQGDMPFLALAEVIWCQDGPEEKSDGTSLIGLQFRNLGRQKQTLLAWHVQQLVLAGQMLPAL